MNRLKWQLCISYNKCTHMYVSITITIKLNMSVHSTTLPVVREVKDLGVVVGIHLTFHSHIDKIVASAFMLART